MILRCTLDGLLLPAEIGEEHGSLVACDGDEAFRLEALEVLYYELVSAAPEEMSRLRHARYRLLKTADDFVYEECG